MVKESFHIDIGKFKCIVFSDGTLVNQDSDSQEEFGLSCLFIDTGDNKVLIETGCGDIFQSTAGRLVKNIQAEGIKCVDIDKIVFSHGHIDHVGGTFDSQGRPVFPHARYITSEREWAYWITPPGSNELQNMFFGPARKNLVPIREKFDLIKGNREVLPGIKFISAPGHTPGTVTIEISSGKERLFCIGDLIHSPREFTNPKHLAAFDVTPEQAIKTRARVLADVSKSGVLVFACHFRFPGLGHIVRRGSVFSWQQI